jgi:hypothetical protein
MEESRKSSNIIQLLIKANQLVAEYVEVHDTYVKKTGSIFKIFKPINFLELANGAKVVQIKINELMREVEKCDVQGVPSGESVKDTLVEYLKLLDNTCKIFFDMQINLDAVRTNRNQYTLSQHQRLSRQYEDSIKAYTNKGLELNTLYHMVQEAQSD